MPINKFLETINEDNESIEYAGTGSAPLAVRRDKGQLEFLSNAKDAIKAVAGDENAGARLLIRKQETFGQYPATEAFADMASFALGASLGAKAAKKIAENAILKMAAETVTGTLAQTAISGEYTKTDPGRGFKTEISEKDIALNTILNLPLEGILKLREPVGVKPVSNTDELIQTKTGKKRNIDSKQDWINEKGEYEAKSFQEAYLGMDEKPDFVPTDRIDSAMYIPEKNIVLYNPKMDRDKLDNILQHELGHYVENKKRDFQNNQGKIADEEYVRHHDTLINAILNGDMDTAEKSIQAIIKYNGGKEPETVGNIIDYINDVGEKIDNGERISKKQIESDITNILMNDERYRNYFSNKDKADWIYKGEEKLDPVGGGMKKTKRGVQYKFPTDEELKIGLKAINDPAKAAAWLERTYGIKSPKIVFSDFNGYKNGVIHIAKNQSKKEKLISLIHEAIHKQDIESGYHAKTSPKPAGSPDELFTYASDFILAKKLNDRKLMEHSVRELLKNTDILPTKNGVLKSGNRKTIKYIMSNIDKARKAKEQKVNYDIIYDFLKNPSEKKISSFIDEIDKLREHKIATEEHDFTLSGKKDILTEKLIQKGYKEKDIPKIIENGLSKYDYKQLSKIIDEDALDQALKIEPVRSMSAQGRLKSKLFEKLNKSTKEISNVTKESDSYNKSSLKYDDISVEKNYIDKAYEAIKNGFLSNEDTKRIIVETIKSKLLNKVKNKEITKDEYRKKVLEELNNVKKDFPKFLESRDFKDELIRNIDIYTEPAIDKNRIVFDRVNMDEVFKYFFENPKRKAKEKADEQMNKRLEKAEQKAVEEKIEQYNNRIKERQNRISQKVFEQVKKEDGLKINEKTEPQAGSNKHKNRKTESPIQEPGSERIELRYAKDAYKAYIQFKPKEVIKTDFTLKEYLKFEDYAKNKLGTYYKRTKQAFAVGGNKYIQSVAAMHEFLHHIYPDKAESQIVRESFRIINYMVKNSDSFRSRLGLDESFVKKIRTKDPDPDIFKYIYGNEDIKEILFGKEPVKSAFDKLEEHISKFIDNKLDQSKITQSIKNIYEKSPKVIKDIFEETLREDEIAKKISHIKQEAKIIITNNIKHLNKRSNEFIEKYGEDNLSALFITGLYRNFDPVDELLFDTEKAKLAYAEMSKKYKNFDAYIKNSYDPMGAKKYSLNSYGEWKRKFNDDTDKVLTLLALSRFKKRTGSSAISRAMLEDYKKIANIVDEINPIEKDSQIVGYYPHVLDTTYDIKIAYTKADETKLKNDGYKEFEKGIFYKRDTDPVETSELFFYRNDEKHFGFARTLTKSETKEAIKRFGRNRLKITKISSNEYYVRYQPNRKTIQSIADMSNDPVVLISYTYKKNFEEFFNKNIFSKQFKKALDQIGADESDILRSFDDKTKIDINQLKKDGMVLIEDKSKIKFLNKIFGKEAQFYAVNEKYADYFFNREILPKNEHLALAFKIWKSLVGKMKWHLTGLSVSAFNNAVIGGVINLAYIGVNPRRIYRLAKETLEERKEFGKYIDQYEKILEERGFKEAQKFLIDNKKNNTFIEVMLDSEVGSLYENPDVILGRGRTYADNVLIEELKKIDRIFGTNSSKYIYNGLRYFTLDRTTAVGKFLMDKYSSIDLFQRVMAYKYLKTRYGKKEAIDKINDIFVDFGKLQKPVNSAIDLGVAPFWTWTLRMQGGLLRVAKDKPLTMGAMIGIYITIQSMFDDEFKYDEFAGDLRVESWFIHNVFLDTMILETNLATQFYKGRVDKILELMFMPKTYEELIAVSEDKRDPLELLGFNMKPEWMKYAS